jgi:GLPGLI family protein
VKKEDFTFGETLIAIMMKNFLLSFCLTASVMSQAQMKEGRIIYERTIQLPARMFNSDPEIASQLPKSRTEQFELLFGNNQSLWQFLPNVNNEDPGSFSGGGVVLRFGGMNEISYYNFEKGTRTDQREVMDRNFVVSDSIRKGEWKLTEETKTLLNHTVRKAIGQRISNHTQMTMENGELKRQVIPDTSVVIAWFTTDIPVPVGPEMQGQLPGAILELEYNKGQTIYKALEISPQVNITKIKEPKDGKKVTTAEFSKEREKLMEEMRRNMPNRGNGVFRIQQ